MRPGRRGRAAFAMLIGLSVVVAGCGSAPILANSPVARPAPPATPSASPAPSDPLPVSLPADDAAHHRLTEWWYYTGHLATGDGHHYGFEFVIFRAERGPLPVTWASHVALTDEDGGTFHYAQRTEIGPQVNVAATTPATAKSGTIDLSVSSLNFLNGQTLPPWQMSGYDGVDRLSVALTSDEAKKAGLEGLSFDLNTKPLKPPVLENTYGWVAFGQAAGSYYYSRTSLAVEGSLVVNGKPASVTGEAWFDHQWGDFIAVGGGWDWFAVNLADRTDLMLSVVRDAHGTVAGAYGTLVRADGTAAHLSSDAFTVSTSAEWTSPTTGATYPAGWRIELPAEHLQVVLRPTVADQELDTRPSTGVVYWEGSQRVEATHDGAAVGGQAYVELTGYWVGH